MVLSLNRDFQGPVLFLHFMAEDTGHGQYQKHSDVTVKTEQACMVFPDMSVVIITLFIHGFFQLQEGTLTEDISLPRSNISNIA